MAINLFSKASVDSLLSAKLSISSLSNAAATTLNATAPTTDQVLSFDGTELKWATVSGGGGLTISTLSNGATSTLNATAPTTGQALTFDGTDLKWATLSGAGTLTYSSPYIYDTVTASNINSLDLGSGTLTSGQTIGGNATIDSSGLTLAASSGAVITFADATTQSTAPHDLPSGGTTGQVLTKNSATNYDASWATPSGGGGGVNIQTFGSSTTSGTFTWTKPANAKWVEIYLWGSGGGGGSGAKQATTSIRSGGSGGGGGTFLYERINAEKLGSTETVVIAAGAAGVAGRTTDNTNGITGNSVTTATSFSIYRATNGSNGSAGNNLGSPSGGTSKSSQNSIYTLSGYGAGGNGNTANGGAATSQGGVIHVPTGGGGGAGAQANVTTNASGGIGGQIGSPLAGSGSYVTISGGSGGSTLGVAATAGTSATTNYTQAGTGGGGGFYRTGQSAGNGASGGWPGGGGGGGGAADNGAGISSGAGGAGANGFAVIITYT